MARESVQAIARYEAAGPWLAGAEPLRALADQLDSPGELALLSARAPKSRMAGINCRCKSARRLMPAGSTCRRWPSRSASFRPRPISPGRARRWPMRLPVRKAPSTRRRFAGRCPRPAATPALDGQGGRRPARHRLCAGQADPGSRLQRDTRRALSRRADRRLRRLLHPHFIAYNAGPRKVPEWIERYGDPRGKSIDEVVDWIDASPSRDAQLRDAGDGELSGLQEPLGQTTDIVHDLRFGR